jgi:hypothetical protein
MMKIHRIYKSFLPINFISQEVLLVYKRGIFYSLNLNTLSINLIAKFKFDTFTYILSQITIFERIFRLGIRTSILYKNDLLIFSFKKKIYELDLKKNKISNGFDLINSRPLNFEVIEGITDIEDGVYFGEYKSNPNKDEVSIYKRIGVDQWEIVYTFKKGIIEHVHNIVSDKFNNSVYVLTGDQDESAAIWSVKNNFKLVETIFKGNQIYRSCVAFPTSEGLVYATDSPFSKNSIRILKKNDSQEWSSTELCKINGPSIYGVKFNNDLIFSTSVEGQGNSSNFLYNLFSIKRGSGIVDNFSCVYKGNLKDGFELIYRSKKDKLPYLLFQFGVILFPGCEIHGDYLPIYEIGTINYNMSMVVLKK